MSIEFMEKLNTLTSKIKQQSGAIETEEATKNAFVMPFINNVLGYDVLILPKLFQNLYVILVLKR